VVAQDAAQSLKHFSPEDLAFDGRTSPLVVAKQDSVLPEFLSEHTILCQEILDGLLLSAIDPAGKDQEQELPWLQLCFHIPPDAW
jgi:hypothetical protein